MKKKLVSLALATALLVGVSSVAEGAFFSKKKAKTEVAAVEVDANSPGWKQDKTEETFDWYINFSWYKGKWGRDGATQTITEDTGVTAKYIMPIGDGGQKVTTMIASNTLPDLLTVGWYEGAYNDLIEGGLVYAIDELAEKYDPYFFKVASKEKLGWYTEKDGHVYGYPNASYTEEDLENGKDSIISNQAFMVRKDIYEAIGSPDMTTTEGFLNALVKAKEMFPEVDGQSLIPIVGTEFSNSDSSFGGYLQDFLAVPMEQDGKAYDRRKNPDYIKWLKMFRKANEMGLINPEIFVDKRQQIEDKMVQGRYFAMMYPHIDALQPLTNIYNNNPERMYISVPGPKNSNGDEHTLPGPGISGWTVTMISKNCKNPAKAIRFFTYMMSEEGNRTAFFGKEGYSWEYVDGTPKLLPEVAEMRATQREQYDQLHGGDYMNWMFMDNAMQLRLWPDETVGAMTQVRDFTKGKVQPRFIYERWDPTGQQEEAIISQKTGLKWAATMPKLLTAETDAEFDEILESYFADSEKAGIQKLWDYRTVKMNENKAKLGM